MRFMERPILNKAKTILAVFFVSSSLWANSSKKEWISIGYFNQIFGHVHQNPSRYSSSMTTISCGHPVKILPRPPVKTNKGIFKDDGWVPVKVGPYKGHLRVEYIQSKRPKCFQDKYPKFFEAFNLEINENYYWGKLYDQYVHGKTKAK